MKFFLVSDDADTCTGMRLAGVFFMLAHDKQTAQRALEQARDDADVGMLLITKKIREFCPEIVEEISKGSRPVLVEIPDSRDAGKSTGSVSDYIKSTVGISV